MAAGRRRDSLTLIIMTRRLGLCQWLLRLLMWPFRMMALAVRTIVSGDKVRTRDGYYDLDLSYIEPNLAGLSISLTHSHAHTLSLSACLTCTSAPFPLL